MTHLPLTVSFPISARWSRGIVPNPTALLAGLIGTCEQHGFGVDGMAAIRSLQGLTPEIGYTDGVEARYSVYVPVNSRVSVGASLSQPCGLAEMTYRELSTCDQDEPYTVTYHYSVADQHVDKLTALIHRLHYLGASESFAYGRIDNPLPPRISASERGHTTIQIPGEGYCEHWMEAWGIGAYGERYRRNVLYGDVRYNHGSLNYMFRISGHIGLEYAACVASGLRSAVLQRSKAMFGVDEHPQLYGHNKDAGPGIGFIPIPDVGHQHAKGHLMGICARLPAELSPTARDQFLEAIADVVEFKVSIGNFAKVLALIRHDDDPKALQRFTWMRPSKFWETVTPIVMEHTVRSQDVYRKLFGTFARAGYPRPMRIALGDQYGALGSAMARTTVPHKSKYNRVHAYAEFAEAIPGPVVVGCERNFGLGLMRPRERRDILND